MSGLILWILENLWFDDLCAEKVRDRLKFVFSPDIISCDWPGSECQLTHLLFIFPSKCTPNRGPLLSSGHFFFSETFPFMFPHEWSAYQGPPLVWDYLFWNFSNPIIKVYLSFKATLMFKTVLKGALHCRIFSKVSPSSACLVLFRFCFLFPAASFGGGQILRLKHHSGAIFASCVAFMLSFVNE